MVVDDSRPLFEALSPPDQCVTVWLLEPAESCATGTEQSHIVGEFNAPAGDVWRLVAT